MKYDSTRIHRHLNEHHNELVFELYISPSCPLEQSPYDTDSFLAG